AMVVSPVLRGLLGLEASAAGRVLTFAPELPADWDRVTVRNVAAGDARVDLALERGRGEETVTLTRRGGSASPLRVRVAPAFPLDAAVRAATVDGRAMPTKVTRQGDVLRVEVELEVTGSHRVVFSLDEGTGVYSAVDAPRRGATSQGLRILRARVEDQPESERPTPALCVCRSPRESRSREDVQISCCVTARDTACRGAPSRAWQGALLIPGACRSHRRMSALTGESRTCRDSSLLFASARARPHK